MLKKIKISFKSNELQKEFSFYYPIKTNKAWIKLNVDGISCLTYNKTMNYSEYNIDNLEINFVNKYPYEICNQGLLPLGNCYDKSYSGEVNQTVELKINGQVKQRIDLPVQFA